MSEQTAAAYGAFLLRVSLGLALVAHGLLKVLVFTVPGTVSYFESIGYPGFFAYLVIGAEIGLGAALVLGFRVRAAALAAVPILVGATLEHLGNGWLFTAEGGGWEYPALWTLALVAQALIGPGAFAIDGASGDRATRKAVAA